MDRPARISTRHRNKEQHIYQLYITDIYRMFYTENSRKYIILKYIWDIF